MWGVSSCLAYFRSLFWFPTIFTSSSGTCSPSSRRRLFQQIKFDELNVYVSSNNWISVFYLLKHKIHFYLTKRKASNDLWWQQMSSEGWLWPQGLIFDIHALDFSSSPSVSSSCVFSLVFSPVMSVFSPFSYLTSCLLLGGCGSLFVV